MQPALLLSLLGAVGLAAVNSMPVDNGNHNEEMVTRCIIEVLSNALSKSSAPPITPECRQVLKKSRKEVKDKETTENENTKFEVRLLRDPADASEAHGPSSREEAGAPAEKDTQSPTQADTEPWAEGGGHSRERVDEPQRSLYPSDSQVSEEAKTSHSEKNEREEVEEEEGENYQKGERGEDGSEEIHLEGPGETQNTFLNERNQASATKKEELVARSDTRADGHSEEKTHSREKSSQESGEEAGSQEKQPQESKGQPQSQEESEEGEEDATSEVAKRRTRPRHHHGRSRPDRSSQGGSLPSEERGHPLEESEESNVGMASLGERRDHHSTHYRASEEEPEYGDVKSYPGVQDSEDLEGERYRGRGSEEYGAPRPQSEESWDEEDKRNYPGLELDKMARGYEESEEERGQEQGKGRHHRGRGGEPRAYFMSDTREEKRFLGEGHHHVQESQIDKARRRPQGAWKELDRNYLSYGEEGAQGKRQQQGDLQDTRENREEARFQEKQYGSHHTAEKRKRLGELFNPYHDPLQWQRSHFERRDNMDDNFLEGEEENELSLNEKNFFPEYNYDWWEKKPFSEDVNWGYEKRNLARVPKLDLKRQYDRVAQLDQLLHYRKKSAEFPDFYDSEEPMSTLQEAENEKDRPDQRVLTEDEEKELENLAAMDLELQKIAEKFSQRG
uniref:Secretogranin-1 n=1 Tax=Saimiri boliviensis boliviensis TaxID=39432 RepID=A0A2K6V731_SAIBB|nr:secretogranin-1 [Saimiri boliviensis boliviensis]